jgi:chitinase
VRLRFVAMLGVLSFLGNALFGVGWSGASWSTGSATALAVVAANDWTPPSVTVSSLAPVVQGTVTVTATASDARSPIDPASVVVELRAVGSTGWTAYAGCTRAGTNPVTASCSWNTTLLPDGDYEVRARATDTAGYATTSATVTTSIRNSVVVRLTRLATYLRGTVPVTGTVVDSGGSSTAQVHLESSPTGSTTFSELNGACTAAPVTSLTCQWDTSKVRDGSYDVRARAVTTSTSLDLQAGVIVDNTLPTATLGVPAGVLSGYVALNATASDATSGVSGVALQYRTGPAGWTTCAPTTGTYSCSLDTTTLLNGVSYEFRTLVTDAAGNSNTTAIQTRVVDNSPATVAIASPATGTVLGGVTTVSVSATSPRGVSSVRVEYRTGSGAWATACTAPAAPYSCTWDTRPLTGGYELRAVAVETYGGATPVSASVPITIDNSDGTVTVTSPVASAVVAGTVTLQASTASPTGVTSVALQVRAGSTGTWTTVCTDTTSPYTCDWATPTEYNTAWQVQALMAQGNQRVVTSAAVGVTVRNVTGSVAITSPATGGTVRGSAVALTATATSNAGVTAVKFQMTAPNGTVTACAATGTGPYSCSWNTTAITYGSYVITAVMTRGDGSTQTSAPVTVAVDNRAVRGLDVQAANGGVSGIPDAGDTVTFTYSALMDLSTIRAGLAYGSAAGVGVTLTGGTGQLGDTLAITGANLGSVTVASNFYSNNKTLVFNGSTITATQGADANNQPVTVVTVRLGTAAAIPNGESLKAVTTAAGLIWTPSGSARDVGGVACATTVANESGVSDLDF